MAVLLLLSVLLQFAPLISAKNITFLALSNVNLENVDVDANSVVVGQWLAIQEINNNTQLLPNFTLNLEGTFFQPLHHDQYRN